MGASLFTQVVEAKYVDKMQLQKRKIKKKATKKNIVKMKSHAEMINQNFENVRLLD